jgi:hypothetical protein
MRAKTKAALIDACVLTQKCNSTPLSTQAERDAAAIAVDTALTLVEEDAQQRDGAAFAGAFYDPASDNERLFGQLGRVFECMRDSVYRTLGEIAGETGDPQASISAQLRHLRKPWHGSYLVDVQARGERTKGLFEYRLRSPKGAILAVDAKPRSQCSRRQRPSSEDMLDTA